MTVRLPMAAAVALLLPASAGAQAIRATVNTNETTVEDPIVLSVTVEGSRRVEPQLPALPDFRVVPGNSSSQVQMINGRVTSSVTYQYLLQPVRTGVFTIGPATVSMDGRIYESRPFQVKVLDASSEPSDSRLLFTRATVSTTEPYVGEQVLYTWRLYHRVQLGDARLEELEFGGLLAEDLGETREYTTTLGGVQYVVKEIRKALFAQEVGTATLPPSRLSVQVAVQTPGRRRRLLDDFFGRVQTQTRILTTPPIQLQVRDLPAAPGGFSGLVGDFDLRSEISKQELQVGESTTLVLALAGSGNVQLMGEPPLPELVDFKVYPDKPSSRVERAASGLTAKKVYRAALVPLVPGTLVVPPVRLVYFDPRQGSYRTASTRELVLDVRPSEGKEELMLTESVAPTTGKVAVRILADDILPVHRGFDAVRNQRVSGVSALAWNLGWVLPPVGFAALLLVRRRQERFAADAGLKRRRSALRQALGELRRLRGEGGRMEAPALARRASRCLRQYIGDKLDAEGGALTSAEAEGLLEQRGADPAAAAEARGLLERLEAAQFGAAASSLDPAALSSRLEGVVKRLDRRLSQGRR